MNHRYFCQDGDNDDWHILLPIGTKDPEKGIVKADQMLNDLSSALSFTIDNYDSLKKHKSPNFIKALKQIDKKIWKCLKEGK